MGAFVAVCLVDGALVWELTKFGFEVGDNVCLFVTSTSGDEITGKLSCSAGKITSCSSSSAPKRFKISLCSSVGGVMVVYCIDWCDDYSIGFEWMFGN